MKWGNIWSSSFLSIWLYSCSRSEKSIITICIPNPNIFIPEKHSTLKVMRVPWEMADYRGGAGKVQDEPGISYCLRKKVLKE